MQLLYYPGSPELGCPGPCTCNVNDSLGKVSQKKQKRKDNRQKRKDARQKRKETKREAKQKRIEAKVNRRETRMQKRTARAQAKPEQIKQRKETINKLIDTGTAIAKEKFGVKLPDAELLKQTAAQIQDIQRRPSATPEPESLEEFEDIRAPEQLKPKSQGEQKEWIKGVSNTTTAVVGGTIAVLTGVILITKLKK